MTAIELIRASLKEDIPAGDITTDSLGIKEKLGRARLVAKEDLVLSGRDFFAATMKEMNSELMIHWQYDEGAFVLSGQTLASITGNLLPVLQAERVALNFLGHFSGIATYTRCFVKEVEGTHCQILDTRKTLPLYRAWEKQAVLHGRGHNHRMSLSEAVLIKENHIRVAGGLREAITRTREKTSKPIEIECCTLDEVLVAASMGVQRILLDNMSNDLMRVALEKIPKSIEVEASGNMSLERVKSVAELGVDFISVGAITHSAPCADFSLQFDWKNS
ncbi:MAG: carboxylating nicotinate-nucleotide diphosphorylase [Bdellovibrionales bacterium]|nr:carboxylating nicotinate-nucleotide diphosphorylase [Bdellovibrionales bacterium]